MDNRYLCSLTLLLVILCNLQSSECSGLYRRFSTKTCYNASVTMDKKFGFETKRDSIPSCRSVQVVALFRHGTRYPGESDIIETNAVMEKIRQAAGNKENDLIKELSESLAKFVVKDSKELASTGKEEHKALGQRFRERFSHLVSSHQDATLISSEKSRCIDSCNSFQEGFNTESNAVWTIPEMRNDLLRYFDNCEIYVKKIASNKTAISEVKVFQKKAFQNVVERVSKFFSDSVMQISGNEMKSVYTIAASEVAVFGTSSWSKLFTDDDLELLEFASDIKNYWKKGYGYPINYEQSCILVNHMFTQIDNFINGNSMKSAVFYFGHTETVIPVLSILGLFHDDIPLTANNYDLLKNRLFRTSRISPFAVNIAFVLHRCEGVADPESYLLEVLFKEMPLALPACDGQLMCPYKNVRAYYSKYIDRCAFDEMCDDEDDGKQTSSEKHNEL